MTQAHSVTPGTCVGYALVRAEVFPLAVTLAQSVLALGHKDLGTPVRQVWNEDRTQGVLNFVKGREAQQLHVEQPGVEQVKARDNRFLLRANNSRAGQKLVQGVLEVLASLGEVRFHAEGDVYKAKRLRPQILDFSGLVARGYLGATLVQLRTWEDLGALGHLNFMSFQNCTGLTPEQVKQARSDPDLLLQFCEAASIARDTEYEKALAEH